MPLGIIRRADEAGFLTMCRVWSVTTSGTLQRTLYHSHDRLFLVSPKFLEPCAIQVVIASRLVIGTGTIEWHLEQRHSEFGQLNCPASPKTLRSTRLA
jgi:hypothetical protein